MREEISLTRAKQSFKRNMHKYETGDNLEGVIYQYQLREDELDSLKAYVIKLVPQDEFKINWKIEQIKKEMQYIEKVCCC